MSAQTNDTEIDIQGINGDAEAAGLGVTHGTELMKFAESIATGNGKHLSSARRALFEAAGERVLVDAAAVAANFQRMVRNADAMGIPVDDMAREGSAQIREELNLNRFASAQNSLIRLGRRQMDTSE